MTRSYTRYGRETTPIHEAAEKGDVNALRRALANGASPNDHDQNGWEPLQYLCFHGDNEDGRLACLKALVEAGADINAGLDEWTNNRPLMYAAQYSNANVVAALLKSGADVNLGNSSNLMPIHWACNACVRGDSDVERASVLIRSGATVNARDGQGRTALDKLIEHCQRHSSGIYLLPILVRAGASLSARTTNAYIRKVIAADGIQRYERAHLNALAASFAPKFSHLLPPELVRRVVEYAFHVGDY